FIGVKYNFQLHHEWVHIINPSKKYVFENDNGNQSLNAILPAFFNDQSLPPDDVIHTNVNSVREIVHIPYQTLLFIMQITRIFLLLSIIPVILFKQKVRTPGNEHVYFYWELGYIMLISLLIFPHQLNYSML